jgi:hypothetical protein
MLSVSAVTSRTLPSGYRNLIEQRQFGQIRSIGVPVEIHRRS